MNRSRIVRIAYYGLLGGLLALILTDLLVEIAPSRWARRLSYNSEGYLLALVLAAWIEFVLPRRTTDRLLRWALVTGVTCIALGAFLVSTDLPSRLRTLNESMFALALAIPYVTLARPLGRWVPWISVALAGVVVAAIALDADSWAVTQAEAIGFAVLIPLALDVVDRGILDPRASTAPGVRWTWYTLLISQMAVVSAVGADARSGDRVIPGILDYLGRVHESVIGVLLVQLYFAVGLGRRGVEGPLWRS